MTKLCEKRDYFGLADAYNFRTHLLCVSMIKNVYLSCYKIKTEYCGKGNGGAATDSICESEFRYSEHARARFRLAKLCLTLWTLVI